MTLASAAPLRIQLCGPTVVEWHSKRIEGQLPGRQGRLLFAYLTLNRHRPVGRDELIAALWPTQPPRSIQTGLNSLISKLRKVLGPDVLEGRSSLRLRLDPDAIIDVETAIAAVHKAESRIAQGEWKLAWGPSLVALFVAEREFLPGEDLPWVTDERTLLGDIHLRALEAYGYSALGTGHTEVLAAVRAGRQLVRLAPLRENGYRILMQALADQGNVAEALFVYNALSERLRDELGIYPCAATQAVYQGLLGP